MFHNLFSFSNIVPLIRYCEENLVEPDKSQMEIWCMRIARCILKARHPLRMCDTHCFASATIVTQMRVVVKRYVRCLCMFCTSLNSEDTDYKDRSVQALLINNTLN